MRALRDRGLEDELAAARVRIAELEAAVADHGRHDPIARELLTLKAFRTQLDLDVTRAHRYGRPLAVALIDIDGFKALNARHGLAAGDEVLAAVGRLLAEATRVNDLACRTSADEFALALPESSRDASMQAVGRVLERLEDMGVGEVRSLSASIGVAILEPSQTAAELLAACAASLDRAREAGGGRAVFGHGFDGDRFEEAGEGDVVAALAQALTERDNYTGDHSESVVEMCARVGESLGLDDEEVSMIRTAALLHDIGKVGVPDQILHKPGPLDDEEWKVMRLHPITGERILRSIPGMGRIARIVRHEHERWDGGGYPDGLHGEEIPVGARIILACDAYHAMTSDRPYRQAMSHADASAELSRHAGTQFDPDVAQALIGYLYGARQSGVAIG